MCRPLGVMPVAATWVAMFLVVVSAGRGSLANEDGFESLFDGKSLGGWSAVPPASQSDWSVCDGAISGIGSADRQVYLVWKDRGLDNFDLRFEYRLLTHGNTGVEIRAQPDPTGRRPFVGYHADLGHVGIGDQVLGAWDFHFARTWGRKEHPCPRGTRLTIAADDTIRSERIPEAIQVSEVRGEGQWNDVRVLADGARCQFFLNGRPASEFTDAIATNRLTQGAIGLQLHEAGMHVEFRNLRLKKLPAGKGPEPN